MQPHTEHSTKDEPADWPSLVEFKRSRFPDYDPATDADAEQEYEGATPDFVLPE
ncbi:MAG TPA: hypothetical protein VFY31_09850 [Macromonas sp.]|nr:hypothetical protein [Macromonas sp.]